MQVQTPCSNRRPQGGSTKYLRWRANIDKKLMSGHCLLGMAPVAKEFADMWNRLQSNSEQPRQPQRKHRTLEWCLFEAVRDRALDFQVAKCMTLFPLESPA